MAILDRDAILAARRLKKELLAVPELGGEIYVRVMNGEESDLFNERFLLHQEITSNNRLPHMRALLATLTVCDEEGGRLFSLDELDLVNSLDKDTLDTIFAVAAKLNGLTPEAVDDLTKNSPASDPMSASGTASPSPLADAASPNGSA